jgi:hypothetical protein
VIQSHKLLRVLTLHCESAAELSSRELDETLPRLDRFALICHVLVCRSCRRFRAQLRLIRKAVRRGAQRRDATIASEGRLSAEARARICQACHDLGPEDIEAGPT